MMLSLFVVCATGAFENIAMTEADGRRRGSAQMSLHVLTNNTGRNINLHVSCSVRIRTNRYVEVWLPNL